MRKTKEEALQTKEGILEAAAVVFAAKGVAKSSLDEIAKRAGVTRGAVYWHFKNKVDIFHALHDQLHTPFMDTILHDLENDHPHPLEQLEKICVQVLEDVARNKQKQRIFRIMFLKCDFSGELETVLDDSNKRKAEGSSALARYFEHAKAMGHLSKNADPQSLTRSLFCYLTGIMQEYVRSPKPINLEKNAATMVRVFFEGASRA